MRIYPKTTIYLVILAFILSIGLFYGFLTITSTVSDQIITNLIINPHNYK